MCFDSFVAPLRETRRWPEPRPHFDRDEDPGCLCLSAGEGANLVGLELLDAESTDSSAVETAASGRRLLEPARDGVPGNSLDPSNRGNADAFDSEGDDRVESSSSMLETLLLVGRASRRRERLFALDAPVSTAFPGPRSVESVADDASGTGFSMQRTLGVETAQLLHFAWPFLMKERVLSKSGSNSSTRTG